MHGRSDVVTLRTTVAKILQLFKDSPQTDDEEAEKRKIVRAAAELIKSDIKNIESNRDFYPDTSALGSLENNLKYVPQVLRIFLQEVFRGKSCELQTASIGQCIMQMARPRVLLAPIEFGLAVEMHQHFGSRYLVDILNSHGFCLPYSEVIRFSTCAANFQGTDIPTAGRFGQYIADNVDHNFRTLDGQGTYHGMGIAVAVSPGVKDTNIIPRIQSSENSFRAAKIAIKYYRGVSKVGPLAFKKLEPVSESDELENLDTMWKMSWALRPKRVQSLPPTTDGARYHSFRVYCQVHEWIGHSVDPERWGWVLSKGQLEPKTMDSEVAPASLLKVVRCNCKGNCDTKRCSSREHDLECSIACGECRGLCLNSSSNSEENVNDESNEYELHLL